MSQLFSSFRNLRPWPRLFLLISLILICAALGSAIGILLLHTITGLPISELPDYLGQFDNPEAMTNLSWYNNLSQIFVFLIPSLLFAFLMFGGLKRGAWLWSPGSFLLLVPMVVLGLSPVISMIEMINHGLIPPGSWLESLAKPQEEELGKLTQGILQLEKTGGVMWTIISVLIIPPICEEIAFRGVLQPALGRVTKNAHLAIWLTAFLFSFIHFQFYGFLPRMVLGAVFGYMVIWSGSLWTSIFAHALHNTLAFMAFRQTGTMEPNPAEDNDPTMMLYLLSIMGIATLVIMARRSVFESRKADFFGRESQDLIS